MNKTSMGIDHIFVSTPDGELHELGKISEADISLSEEEIKKSDSLFSSEIEFKGEMKLTMAEGKRELNPYRYLASGGDKSAYNAMTLREEGYLSPKNGWIE